MKKLLGLMSLFSVLVAFQANAEAKFISCSNGDLEKMGDRYFRIDLLEDGIQFFPYEGFFSLDATEVTSNSDTFSIINRRVKLSSEGKKFYSTINAMLILNVTKSSLNVAISYDNEAFQAYEMTCVEK